MKQSKLQYINISNCWYEIRNYINAYVPCKTTTIPSAYCRMTNVYSQKTIWKPFISCWIQQLFYGELLWESFVRINMCSSTHSKPVMNATISLRITSVHLTPTEEFWTKHPIQLLWRPCTTTVLSPVLF